MSRRLTNLLNSQLFKAIQSIYSAIESIIAFTLTLKTQHLNALRMNLKNQLNNVQDYFSPKIIGEVNDVYVKVAKIKGDDLPWHNHKDEDELFYIIEGNLLFEIEGQESFTMHKGDLFIIKRGINHRVSSKEECQIMLIENKTTAHTGEIESEITRSIEEQKRS